MLLFFFALERNVLSGTAVPILHPFMFIEKKNNGHLCCITLILVSWL